MIISTTRSSFNRKLNPRPAAHPIPKNHIQLTLDRIYITLRETICNTQFYQSSDRFLRTRFYNWFKCLDHIVPDEDWKRNRNNYAKLMLLMSECQLLLEPFLSLPPEGDLPAMRHPQMNEIIAAVEVIVDTDIAKYGYCNQCAGNDQENINALSNITRRVDTQISQDEKNAGRRTGTGSHMGRFGSEESLIDQLSSSSVRPYVPRRKKTNLQSCNITLDQADEDIDDLSLPAQQYFSWKRSYPTMQPTNRKKREKYICSKSSDFLQQYSTCQAESF